jgi:hypothetical protein
VWIPHHQAEPSIYSFERVVVLSILSSVYSTDHFPSFQTTGFTVTAAGQHSYKQHGFFPPLLHFRSFGSHRARRTNTSSTRSCKTLFQGSKTVE